VPAESVRKTSIRRRMPDVKACVVRIVNFKNFEMQLACGLR
jgi:hypothetical protein